MEVIRSLDARIAEQRMLDHPFYQRWTAGELTRGELQEYARQYYHYAMAFPTFLSAMHTGSDDLEARQYLLENLIEEERGPENHPELWLRFCEALGLDREIVKAGTPNSATAALIDCMRTLSRSSLVEGLAALYTYESQIPEVAKAKIEGLAKFYAIDEPSDIAFFSVHQTADVVHAETSRHLLRQACEDDSAAREAASRTADALYRFLDSVTVN
jgi:pyrroloquinoline-quinone synthase